MSSIERYHPDGTETTMLYVPSSMPDLAVAEYALDQPYELEMYAQELRHEYAEVISARLQVIAEGIMVIDPANEHSIEEEHDTFEGRIINFGVHELLAQHRVVVNLRNDSTNQTRTMVISAREGYESSMFVTDTDRVDQTNEKRPIIDIANKTFTPVEFLSRIASELGFLSVDRNTYDYMRATEEYLEDMYHIKRGTLVNMTGCKAYTIEEGDILLPYQKSHEFDAGYVGEFLGVVPHEIIGLHNRPELQLCIAMALHRGAVVIQPCHYMKDLQPISE